MVVVPVVDADIPPTGVELNSRKVGTDETVILVFGVVLLFVVFDGRVPVPVVCATLLPARGEKMLPVPVELLFATGFVSRLTFVPVFFK